MIVDSRNLPFLALFSGAFPQEPAIPMKISTIN